MNINVGIKGLDEMRRAFAKAPEITSRHINDAIKRTLIIYESEAVKNAPVDKGGLRARREVSVGNLQGFLIFKSNYAAAVHGGSKPHWAPPPVIEDWVKRKFGGSPVQIKNLAFLINKKIATRGTIGRPFLRESIEANGSNKDRFFTDALKNITDELSQK